MLNMGYECGAGGKRRVGSDAPYYRVGHATMPMAVCVWAQVSLCCAQHKLTYVALLETPRGNLVDSMKWLQGNLQNICGAVIHII